MAQKTQKKENLPVKVDVDLQNGGTISYANEVIATIAGVAANEIDGIAGMCVSGGFSEILGRNKNITRGVKVEVGSQEAAVDLYIILEYGKPIQKVAAEVQENVRKALESLTGLHVVRVDVHVQGVSFEKEKKANQNILEASKSPVLAAPTAQETEPAPEAARQEAPVEKQEEPKQDDAPEEKQEEPVKAPEEAAPVEEQALEDTEFCAETLKEEAALEGETDAPAQEASSEDAAPEAEKPKADAAPVEEAPAKPAARRKKKAPEGEAAEDAGEQPVKRPRGRLRS